MAKVLTDKKLIEEFLNRGVENIYPNRKFVEAKLATGTRLTMYLGIDPTGPTLHLGHAIILAKLKKWQEMGHKVVLLIGSFTGMMGDPTDKSAARQQLTKKEVLNNAKKYQKQAAKFISFTGTNPAKLVYNHEWLEDMSFKEVIELASRFTVQRMLERDMFEKRMQEGKPIHLHEFLYPLMQGYDSVVLNTDGEIGGNDQTFNMLAGRDLMKSMLHKEKFVITMKLLTDSSGVKMGKTTGNMITFEDSAGDIYGKIMSWPDEFILSGFELCSRVDIEEINKITKDIQNGANPRDCKMILAREVVTIYYNEAEARKAESDFIQTIQKKEAPDDINIKKLQAKIVNIVDLLVETELAKSKNEARRLIEQAGVKIDNTVVKDINKMVNITTQGVLIQRGKRRFLRVVA